MPGQSQPGTPESAEEVRQQALMLELAPLLVRDTQDKIVYWNRAAEVMFGYPREEAVGRLSHELLHTRFPQPLDQIFDRLRSGLPWQGELQHTRSNGTPISVASQWIAHLDDRGNLESIIEVSIDVTERIKAEAALTRATARFNGIIASAMDAIVSIDSQQRVVLFNPAAEKMFGISAAEAQGQDLNRFIPERFRTAHSHHVEQFGRTGVSTRRMGALRTVAGLRANGEEFPIEASISQVDVDGEKLFTVILRDVTERQRADADRAQLAAIVQSSHDAIIGKSLEGVVTSWNAGAEQLFGYSAREMVGQSVLRIIPPDRQAEEAAILARLRRGEHVDHYETARIAKDGRVVEVSLSISPVRDATGAIVGASKIARDITERKRPEEALREAQAALLAHAENLEKTVAQRTTLLRESNAELEAFSYSLAHDMGAPLRAIRNFTQMVVEDCAEKLGPENTELLKKVLSASNRMGRLMQDVLAFSRISRKDLESKVVDVENLVLDIVLEWPELQPPRAEVQLESPLQPVVGQEASLTQCLTNLLGNAVKFVAPGVTPKVRIYSEPRDDQVRLWVEDNGIGIAPDLQQTIFEAFRRIHNTEDYSGSDLGVAIVRKAVERMGGTVGVESAVGQGSKFWIQLPRAPAKAESGDANAWTKP
jgi:PAS domain S-box-containing protein